MKKYFLLILLGLINTAQAADGRQVALDQANAEKYFTMLSGEVTPILDEALVRGNFIINQAVADGDLKVIKKQYSYYLKHKNNIKKNKILHDQVLSVSDRYKKIAASEDSVIESLVADKYNSYLDYQPLFKKYYNVADLKDYIGYIKSNIKEIIILDKKLANLLQDLHYYRIKIDKLAEYSANYEKKTFFKKTKTTGFCKDKTGLIAKSDNVAKSYKALSNKVNRCIYSLNFQVEEVTKDGFIASDLNDEDLGVGLAFDATPEENLSFIYSNNKYQINDKIRGFGYYVGRYSEYLTNGNRTLKAFRKIEPSDFLFYKLPNN